VVNRDLRDGVADGFKLAVEVRFKAKLCQAVISKDVQAIRSTDEQCVVPAEDGEHSVGYVIPGHIARRQVFFTASSIT